MMLPKKDAPVVALALLLAVPLVPKAFAAGQNLAVTPTLPVATFPMPTSVPNGTTVKVAVSGGMTAVNQALKQNFESQFKGSAVTPQAAPDSAAALKALTDKQVDLAAISRPLTAQEKAAGLMELPVSREKIAIVVSADNPFTGELTHQQFAQIFQGAITNWSQVGGADSAIRLLDRPDNSELRSAFQGYPVFEGNFATGANAVKLGQDTTAELVKQLGQDGIGYAPVSQVAGQPGVRLIGMWGTPPTDPRYPFSQPFSYVYRGQDLSPAVQAFLGYASASGTQPIIEQARAGGAAAPAPAPTGEAAPPAPPSPAASPAASPSPAAASPSPAASPGAAAPGAAASPGAASPGAAAPGAASPGSGATALAPTGGAAAPSDTGWNMPSWIWWLLPLGLLALLLGWLFGDRRPEEEVMVEGGEDPGFNPELPNVGANVGAGVGAATAGLAGATMAAGGNALDFARDTTQAGVEGFSNLAGGTVDAAGDMARGAFDFGGDMADAGGNALGDLFDSSRNLMGDTADAAGNLAGGADEMFSGLFGDATDAVGNAATAGGDALGNLAEGGRNLAGNAWAGGAAVAAGAAAAAGAAFSGQGESAGATGTTAKSRIVLVPREPRRAHVYWEIPDAYKDALRQRGGQRLALRMYDVTDLDLSFQTPHSVQQYDCSELARDQDVPVPASDRDYIAEIGYLTADSRWLRLARSAAVRVPSVESY
ncbi:MAG: DUF4912 domain-containing protein [Oculatellaceae cyanobacterium Prado106]|jgi:ABC-type phosphate transport system substrate-binding protein|nr:DUF4912 domain-containing protein [Oculatellaceae cyanobacterium Prado106]